MLTNCSSSFNVNDNLIFVHETDEVEIKIMMPVKRVAVAESAIERKLLNGPLRARLTNSFVLLPRDDREPSIPGNVFAFR